MDINGAKALKQRLGLNGADEAPPVSRRGDIPADAPPVYHWTGVAKPSAEPPAADDEGERPASASLFRRLGPSFR